jgi:hypothetical protein
VSDLDSIVTLTISTNSKSASRLGFGVPVFMSYHTFWSPDKWRKYTDYASVLADGIPASHAIAKFALTFFGQDPNPGFFIAGRLAAAPATTWTVKVTDATSGNKIELLAVDKNGLETQLSYTILPSATTTTVATAVELLIEALADVDSTSSTDTITATPTTSGNRFWFSNPKGCEIKETTAAATYDTELSALLLLNTDWFFVCLDSQSQANTNAVAAWALANGKIFLADTSATDELTGVGTVGSTLKAATNGAVAVSFAQEAQDYESGALAAIVGSHDPGSITTAYQTLEGVTPASLTPTQQSNLETDNINHVQLKRGVSILRPGKVASGEWLDVVHGIAALEAAIQEDQFDLLINAGKLPYTDEGIALIVNVLQGTLRRFEASGFLVKGSSKITVPTAKEIASSVKKTRALPGVKFSAEIAGAIHSMSIQGTLTQ